MQPEGDGDKGVESMTIMDASDRIMAMMVERSWSASPLASDRQGVATLTNADRDLLWHDAAQYRWSAGDVVRESVRQFLLDSLRTVGFAHVRNLAEVSAPGVHIPPGFTFLLRQIGRIVEQNGEGALTQVLRDSGGEGSTEIAYHCHTADLLVLLCLQPAADGAGRTKLVSGRTVLDLIRAERPDVLETLVKQGFWFDRRGRAGRQIIVRPIFQVLPDGAVDTFYQSRTVRDTPSTYGPPLTAAQFEALAVLDEVLGRPDTGHSVSMQAGDLLVIRNSRVMHGRSPYVDTPGPLSRRMLRIWMDTKEL
jgi:hypothetical protein